MTSSSSPADLTWGAQLTWGTQTLRDAGRSPEGPVPGTTGSPTPKLDASVLLAHLLQVPRTILIAYPEREIAPDVAARYAEWIARRADGEPVAYLTGHKEFMGLDFTVDRRVLVPRPETELVVEAALNAVSERFGNLDDNDATPEAGGSGASPVPQERGPVPDLLAADIGTGSGAIAVTLARLEQRIGRVYAVDISPDALAVARHNGDRLHVSDRITWLQGDLLDPLPVPVDLIVANLPYVSDAADDIQPNVAKHEPHIALFGADGGLGHIQRLLDQAPAKLRPNGTIVLEFGYQQRDPIAAIAARVFPAAQLRFGQDYAGWDRYVVIQT
jgi:release factor glutamine methyltransferase